MTEVKGNGTYSAKNSKKRFMLKFHTNKVDYAVKQKMQLVLTRVIIPTINTQI